MSSDFEQWPAMVGMNAHPTGFGTFAMIFE
jgi:hypothetical protein